MLPDLSDALTAAKGLLGWKLVRVINGKRVAGIIVETEAYMAHDMASHSYRGETLRNGSVFRPSGTIYVYFTYGMHYCVNIVTGTEGDGQAVLLRALEPAEGVESMKKRRKIEDVHNLTNGPAKLAQALDITKDVNGSSLQSGPLYLEPGIRPEGITQTTRIGISSDTHRKWRFYITGNPFVSRT